MSAKYMNEEVNTQSFARFKILIAFIAFLLAMFFIPVGNAFADELSQDIAVNQITDESVAISESQNVNDSAINNEPATAAQASESDKLASENFELALSNTDASKDAVVQSNPDAADTLEAQSDADEAYAVSNTDASKDAVVQSNSDAADTLEAQSDTDEAYAVFDSTTGELTIDRGTVPESTETTTVFRDIENYGGFGSLCDKGLA